MSSRSARVDGRPDGDRTVRAGSPRSPPQQRGDIFRGTEPVAERVDELLAGFGES